LQALTSVGGEFWIDNNDQLTDLSPFENLTSLGGNFFIINNASLVNLNGFENIEANTITNLKIADNPSLMQCAIESICNYILMPGTIVEIHDNAPGCNNPGEVEEACIVSVQEFKREDIFSVSPNPCSGNVNLQFVKGELGVIKIDLYEISGVKIRPLLNEVKLPGTYEKEIDMSELPAGIYFCVLKTKEGKQTKKIVKL
jgi:hypothetical protein